jgi:glycosyltransferase involved in cell wall biosynthesis
MKVLNVNMSLDPTLGAGTAERTFQMSRYLARAGVDCTVLTTASGMTPERRQALDGVSVVALPLLSQRFYLPARGYRTIRSLVAQAHVVHLMNHWTFLNAVVYREVRNLHKPFVVCPAGALPVYGRSRFLKKAYNALVGFSILRNASGHIAVTAAERFQFLDYGITPERVTVIPNGIENMGHLGDRDDGRSSDVFRKAFSLGSAPFILFMGRLNSIKGADLLLQAFCGLRGRLGEMHLVFAGPDEGLLAGMKDTIRAAAMEDYVHFVGYVGGQVKVDAYRQAEVLVVPSRQEAMSLVALEAGIQGTPVLLTDQCGFNEVAQSGGGLVVPASVEGLQEGLLQMMTQPRERLRRMGRCMREYVQAHYLWENIVCRYLDLFHRILAQSRAL